MIRLFFESFKYKEIEERIGEDYEIIRLTSHIQFKTPTGWSKIIETISFVAYTNEMDEERLKALEIAMKLEEDGKKFYLNASDKTKQSFANLYCSLP